MTKNLMGDLETGCDKYIVEHLETGLIKFVKADSGSGAVSNFCSLLTPIEQVELLDCDNSWEQIRFNLKVKRKL